MFRSQVYGVDRYDGWFMIMFVGALQGWWKTIMPAQAAAHVY